MIIHKTTFLSYYCVHATIEANYMLGNNCNKYENTNNDYV